MDDDAIQSYTITMLMDADGSNKTPITNSLKEDAVPMFAPAKTFEAKCQFSFLMIIDVEYKTANVLVTSCYIYSSSPFFVPRWGGFGKCEYKIGLVHLAYLGALV